MEWFLLLVPAAMAYGLLYLLAGALDKKTGVGMPKRWLSNAFFAVVSVFFIIAMIPFAILALVFNWRIGFDRISSARAAPVESPKPRASKP